MAALPRGTCQHCGDSVPIRRNGTAREHNYQGGPAMGKCLGSGKPVRESSDSAARQEAR